MFIYAGSLSKSLQEPGLCQVKSKRLELTPSSHLGTGTQTLPSRMALAGGWNQKGSQGWKPDALIRIVELQAESQLL